MSANATLYAILGIDANAGAADIEAAYASRSQALAGNADEQSLLRVAYDTLRHPAQRAAYDRKLTQQNASAATILTVDEGDTSYRPRSPIRGVIFLLLAAAATIGAFFLPKPKPAPKAVAPIVAQAIVASQPESTPAMPTPAEQEADDTPPPGGMPAANPAAAGMVPGSAAAPVQALPTRGTKNPGFDSRYIAWSIFTVRQRNLTGSGVLIGEDRILTNCHVLAGGATNGIVVIHSMTRKVIPVEKYARLDGEDACLLYAPGAGSDTIAWGSAAALRPGDTVHAMGHPGGSANVIWSEGPFRIRVERGGETFLVSETYCRPGSSGGPLLDDEGRLVGVVTAVQRFKAKGGEPPQFGACISVTETTARALLSKPLFPIALAPAQYIPNY